MHGTGAENEGPVIVNTYQWTSLASKEGTTKKTHKNQFLALKINAWPGATTAASRTTTVCLNLTRNFISPFFLVYFPSNFFQSSSRRPDFFHHPVVIESICCLMRAKRLINESKTTGWVKKLGRVRLQTD